MEYGGDEDLAIAALLHDSVEDQGGAARLEDIQHRFGVRVARIVEACSDSLANTARGEAKAHWKERKEDYLKRLRKANEDTLRVSLADKVHNARAILRDLRKPDIGEKVWGRFSRHCHSNSLAWCRRAYIRDRSGRHHRTAICP